MKTFIFSFFLSAACITNNYAQIINAFAGNHTAGYSGDNGPAVSAACYAPAGVTVDAAGNVYFCEIGNSVVRKVSTSGIITTIAGTGEQGFSGNGGPATAAKINQPTSVAVDAAGNVYFTDDANNMIRMVNPAGIITTVAGTGTAGFVDGVPASACQLNNPSGIAIDRKGYIYIADTYNHMIRMIDSSGQINGICGNGSPGYSGDGFSANIASLNFPKGVAVDTSGNIFIVDQGNYVIRKINLSGNISTYAGNGTAGFSGDGGLGFNAELNTPTEVTTDNSGAVYIADFSNHVIRKVLTNGHISTIVGNTTSGYSGDGGYSLAAEMAGPYGVAYNNATSKLYITDEINNVVRVVSMNVSGIESTEATALRTYPNPAPGTFTVDIPTSSSTGKIVISDITGRVVESRTINPGTTSATFSNIGTGTYLVSVSLGNDSYHDKVVVMD